MPGFTPASSITSSASPSRARVLCREGTADNWRDVAMRGGEFGLARLGAAGGQEQRDESNPPRNGEVAARSVDGGGSEPGTPPPPPCSLRCMVPLPVPGRIT